MSHHHTGRGPRLPLLALALCTAASAHAQNEGSWYALPQITWFDPGNNWKVDDTQTGLGLRLGTRLSPEWDMQFGGGRARVSNGNDRYTQTLLGADALYFFSRDSWRPFLLAGAGVERDARMLAGVGASRTSPYLSVGAGLQWQFSPRFGLQADVRRVEGIISNRDSFGFKRSGNNYWGLGLKWSFGDAPTPAAKAAPAAVAVAASPPPPPPPPPPVVKAAPTLPTPPPHPAPPPPRPPERITLQASKLFAFGSARLQAPQPELDRYAQALMGSPQVGSVLITGHTDRLGSATANQKLSLERAQSVKAYLVTQGVDPARLMTRGAGSAQPVARCDQAQRAALVACLEPNRRVEVAPITVDKR